MRGGAAAGARRMPASALASLLLHAGAVLAFAAAHRADPPPAPPREQGVEIVWQDSPQDSAPGENEAAPQASAEVESRQPLAEGAPSLEAALAEAPPPDPEAEAPPPPVEAPPPQSSETPPPPEPPQPQSAEAPPAAEPPPPRTAEALPRHEGSWPPELPPPPPAAPAPAPPRPAARQQQQPAPAQAAMAAARQAPPGPAAPPGASRATGAVSPPGLLEGVRNPDPEYPFASRQRGDQGVVTVRLGVSAAGEVTDVEVIATSGYPALDASARQAVQRWRFRPAMRDGVPIPGSIRTAIHFRLG